MKGIKSKKPLILCGLQYISIVFLSLISFSSYSQTTQPAQTIPPVNQIPRTPPESQPAPSQTYPGSKQMKMHKDTVTHLKKDTSHVVPNTVRKLPPPRK